MTEEKRRRNWRIYFGWSFGKLICVIIKWKLFVVEEDCEAAKDFKVIQSFHINKKKQFPIKNENKDSIT